MAVKMPPIIEVAGVARAAAVLAEEHRQDQRQHDAAELRRLQVERADRNPALRAHLRRALEQDEEQQHAQPAVEEQRVLGQHPVVDRQADEQRDEAEDQRVDLGPDLRPGVAAAGQRDVGGAVDHRDADAGQQQDGAEQQPVDVEVEPAFEHGLWPLSAASRPGRYRDRRDDRVVGRHGGLSRRAPASAAACLPSWRSRSPSRASRSARRSSRARRARRRRRRRSAGCRAARRTRTSRGRARPSCRPGARAGQRDDLRRAGLAGDVAPDDARAAAGAGAVDDHPQPVADRCEVRRLHRYDILAAAAAAPASSPCRRPPP